MAYQLSRRMPEWKKRRAKWLRDNMTYPERLLWRRLSRKQLGVWFYRQRPMLGYIVDFWCPLGIVIEVDGVCHRKRRARDRERDAAFAERGIVTLRFGVRDIKGNIEAVVSVIRGSLREKKANTDGIMEGGRQDKK